MIALVVTVTLVASSPPQGWSLPMSCASLRQMARGTTTAAVERSMLRHNLTERQKAQVRECLKEKSSGARDPRCDGAARYEAMREAYEQGRPQPC